MIDILADFLLNDGAAVILTPFMQPVNIRNDESGYSRFINNLVVLFSRLALHNLFLCE